MFQITSLRQVIGGLTFCFLLGMIAVANASEESSSAELVIHTQEGRELPALLLDTQISGSVSGLVSTISIVQLYKNESDEWVNGQYRFPLPEDAAVDSLTLETEGRILQGVVKEKKQAQQEFQAAKESGKKAGLLKQHRPNLFSMSLANIAPRSEIKATISFVRIVDYENGVFSMRLPTTFTPRFIPGDPLPPQIYGDEEIDTTGVLQVSEGFGWAVKTDEVPDASDITPPQISAPEVPGSHQFSLNLELNAGIPLTNISSLTHAIQITESTDGKQLVTLSNAKENLDRDLELVWTPAANQSPEAAVFRQKGDAGHHSLVMLMPPTKNIVSTLPREVVFIIDSSGSMAGVSILQAQQGLQTALNLLSPADRFNVIDFDSSSHALFSKPQPASQENISRASRFVNNLVADGGTNMREALNLAFAMPQEEQVLKQIVFITDGSVGNERGLFELINQKLGQARLFTVGIGSAPNAHFMRGAANFGRGSYQFISDISTAASQMRELFERLNRPVMKELKVQTDSGVVLDSYPNPLPDLYLGQPVMLTIKTAQPLSSISLSGSVLGEEWQRIININDQTASAKNIDKIWARAKVEQLQNDVVLGLIDHDTAKQRITETGLAYQLVTPHTSFVAVEEKVTKPAEIKAKDSVVPNLMPSGNTMPVPMPNTATPATLLSLLGALMIFGSFFAGRRKKIVAAL